ncbi:S1/P1 nuclease [Daejeonella oryzae]|uniref:S1/P1 nuclease n=1 Tax=Daejeonella oryzae TaxID=1122943 RepID=UPI0003F76C42|nr:S1/P1 nuclease [Daejeonella oryzae]
MKSTVLTKLAFICLLIYAPIQTMAWGMTGHRIVGEIASCYVNKHAQKEISLILGSESLAMSSNWADFIKSEPAFNYLGTWHYANFKDQLNYQTLKDQMEQDTTLNIYNRIKFISSELKNKNLDKSKKQLYLRLLVHFVGDIHQPMHMGKKEDSGGNGIKVFWFNQPSNLHRVWDEQLIEYQQLSYTEYTKVINHATSQQVKNWQKDDLAIWAHESYVASRKLYSEINPEEKLSYKYNYVNVELLNERLLKGGVRLGGLLNQIFSN